MAPGARWTRPGSESLFRSVPSSDLMRTASLSTRRRTTTCCRLGSSLATDKEGITVGLEHEEIARDFLLAGGTSVWTPANVDQLVARMAPDARYHVFAWQEPFVGQDAIREELLRQAPLFEPAGAPEFLNSASVGRTVFIERIDWVQMNGVRAGIHVVGVLEVDDDGKIASWRDYVDSQEIVAKVFTEAVKEGS